MVVHKADSSTAVVLLDTDPYHAMTPLIKIALSQFSDGDQTNNISQAGSMSEAVNNKVRPDKDNHLGFTTYWKYKANSIILLRCIESTACLLF